MSISAGKAVFSEATGIVAKGEGASRRPPGLYGARYLRSDTVATRENCAQRGMIASTERGESVWMGGGACAEGDVVREGGVASRDPKVTVASAGCSIQSRFVENGSGQLQGTHGGAWPGLASVCSAYIRRYLLPARTRARQSCSPRMRATASRTGRSVRTRVLGLMPSRSCG